MEGLLKEKRFKMIDLEKICKGLKNNNIQIHYHFAPEKARKSYSTWS